MSGQGAEASESALGIVENTDLPEYSGAIVIDFFSSQAVFGVEGIDAAERELHSPSGRRQAAPLAEMRAANDDLDQNGLVRDVLALYIDLQIRQRTHELRVETPDSIGTLIMFVPGFVVIVGGVAEGAKDCVQVVVVFQANVFFDEGDAG
jgi:hypothetical protein